MGGFPKSGVSFCGPHSKDYVLGGSIQGSPVFFWEKVISPRSLGCGIETTG